MERMMEKSESWLPKEQGRWALAIVHHRGPLTVGRIAGLLASPSLAPKKLDELKIKGNILSSFAAQKIGEAYGAAQDMAGDAVDAAQDYAGEAVESAKSAAGQATGAAKDAAGQAAEGVDAFVQMMEEKTGAKIKGEL